MSFQLLLFSNNADVDAVETLLVLYDLLISLSTTSNVRGHKPNWTHIFYVNNSNSYYISRSHGIQ